ncbi:MAG TPA: LapA family protein [Nocardioidaceae bacterium]|nr:LapA family protein [Nocardioidaceae bacterium]
MLVLGLVLILLAAGSFVAVLASGTDDKAMLYGGSVEMPTLVIFLAGALALLVIVLGVELVRSGIRRANQNRQTKKRLRKLERREQLRREDQAAAGDTAPAGEAAPAGEPTSGTGTEARPDAGPGSPEGPAGPPTDTPGGPGTGSTGAPRSDGPYQAPPPPSR